MAKGAIDNSSPGNTAGELKQPADANTLGNRETAVDANDETDAAMPPLPDQGDSTDTDIGSDGGTTAGNETDNLVADNTGDAAAGNASDEGKTASDLPPNANTGMGDGVDPNLPPDVTPPVASPQVVGQLTSTDSVLLRFGGEPPSLSRLAQLDNVSTGEPLISLPDFRNVISLGEGVTVQAVGETHFEFETTQSETELPRIHLKQGRLLIGTVGAVGTRIRLRTGELEYALTFLEPGSTLAVDARKIRSDGALPHESACPVELVVDATSGQTIWESFARGGRWELATGTRWAQPANATDAIVINTVPPEWATSLSLTPLAAQAAGRVDEYLRGELATRIRQALLEQLTSNRIEVRALATRSLAAADDFGAILAALNDTEFRAFWNQQIPSLRQAVVRNPQSAALVNIALESQRREYAPELYRMLWGYTATELQDGGHAAKLVEYLSHDDLDFRVLAAWNLREITGITNINYRPEAVRSARMRGAQQWKLKLEAGEIVPGG